MNHAENNESKEQKADSSFLKKLIYIKLAVVIVIAILTVVLIKTI